MRKMIISSQSRPYRQKAAMLASILAAPLILAMGASLSAPAVALTPQCAAREALIDRLAVRYDEQPVSIGVTATGSLLEVLASPAGTWTIIVTVPGGPTCLVSSGEGWHNAPVQLAEDPAV